MPFPAVTFTSELDPIVRKELEQFAALLQGWASREHNDDGTHSVINATALHLSTNPALPGTQVLTLASGDHYNMPIVGTVNLGRQGKYVVRATTAMSTPRVTAVADGPETTAIAGETFVAVNTSGNTIQVLHNSGGYFEHQRILTPGQITYNWVGQQMLLFWYDVVSQRWRFTGEFVPPPVAPTSPFPTGMLGMFDTLCPEGWSEVGAAAERYLKVTTPTAQGGRSTHGHGVDITSDAGGDHTHPFAGSGTASGRVQGNTASAGPNHQHSFTGGGQLDDNTQAHVHAIDLPVSLPVTTSGTTDSRGTHSHRVQGGTAAEAIDPLSYGVRLCRKD